jgi:hypothetical protein
MNVDVHLYYGNYQGIGYIADNDLQLMIKAIFEKSGRYSLACIHAIEVRFKEKDSYHVTFRGVNEISMPPRFVAHVSPSDQNQFHLKPDIRRMVFASVVEKAIS